MSNSAGSLHGLARACAVVTCLLGLGVIGSRLPGGPTLTAFLPALGFVKTNAAFCLVLAGLSVLLLVARPSPWGRSLAHACSMLVCLVAAGTLAEYLFGIDLRIDQLLQQDASLGPVGPLSGRMSPLLAMALLFLGLALPMLDVETQTGLRPAQHAAIVSGWIGLLAVFGHVAALESWPGATQVPVPILSTMGIVLLSLGILLARPDAGLVRSIRADSAAGRLARQLLLVGVGLPPLLGTLVVLGQQNGLYPPSFGLSLLVVSSSALFGLFVWLNATAVETAEQQLRKLADELEQRVAARTAELTVANEVVLRKNRKLESQKEAIEDAHRIKSHFLANMSHELRTPLSAAIGFAEIMRDEELGHISSEYQQCLHHILINSRHLLGVIDDMLQVTRIEAGLLELTAERFNPSDVLGEVVGVVAPEALRKRITVQSFANPSLGEVVLDREKFRQVLLQFVSNALKFTPSGGEVFVRIGPENPGSFRIEVEDSGVGVDPQDLTRLFSLFEQLDSGLTKKYPGTGLGLGLCKRIVEALDGRVGVRSVPEQGSVFSAILPRAITPARQVHRKSPTVPPLPSLAGHPMVLVVDADSEDRQALLTTLAEAGCEAHSASSGAEALSRCSERRFNAIIVAMHLPDLQGWQLLSNIESQTRNHGVPLIVTARAARARPVLDFSIHDVLLKPLRREEVLEALLCALSPPEEALVPSADQPPDPDPHAIDLLPGIPQSSPRRLPQAG